MARKKKGKKKHHHKKRVGGIGGGIVAALKMIGAGTGGILAARGINYAVSKMTTPPSGMMVGGGELAVGALIAAKMKNPYAKCFGIGLAGTGGVTLLGSTGLKVLPAAIGYGPDMLQQIPYRQVPKVGFPKPGNIGFPKPGNIGAHDRDRRRMAAMYAGVYG